MKYEEILKKYISMPFTTDMELIYTEYIKSYSANIDDFKIQYYQQLTDIECNILNTGDIVYYVFGKGLQVGIIEDILPFHIGFHGALIKIKGKKQAINNKCIVIKSSLN